MELAELLAHWGTGSVGGMEAVLQGSVNRVFRVQVSQQTLYLRLYRSSDMTVLEREALVMAARLDGIPVPTALPTHSGAGWMNMDGQLCALFQAVTGFQVVRSDLTVEQARAAGACLARLHRALEPLPDLSWRRYNVAYDPAAWLTRLDALRRAIEGLSDQEMTDAWALERL